MKKEDFYNTKFYLGSDMDANFDIQKRIISMGYTWTNTDTEYPSKPLNLSDYYLFCKDGGKLAYCSYDTCPRWPLMTLEDLQPKETTVQDVYNEHPLKTKFYSLSETQFSFLVGSLRGMDNPYALDVLQGLEMTFPDAPVFVKEKTYQIGDHFRLIGDERVYIMVSPSPQKLQLFCVQDGRKWGGAVSFDDSEYITEATLQNVQIRFFEHFEHIPNETA